MRLFLLALEWLVSRLSFGWAQKLGGCLGLVWHDAIPIRRKTVLENLAAALPNLDEAERRRVAREHYRHLGMSAFEFLWASGRGMPAIHAFFREQGLDHYTEALKHGQGVIAVTGHFGNWDLVASVQASKGVPLNVVTKYLKNKGFNRFWMERREKAGIRFHPDQGSLRQILKALRRNEVVGLVIDQRTPREQGGIETDFMGRPAWTSTTAAVLALRTGAALIPAYGYRNEDGTHVLDVGPAFDLSGFDGGSRESIIRLTGLLNQDLAERIRKRPAQWLWLHRRWLDIQ